MRSLTIFYQTRKTGRADGPSFLWVGHSCDCSCVCAGLGVGRAIEMVLILASMAAMFSD